ncbi:Serine/threonine-protein kinase haspin, partial [Entophlyctis luteolus]
MSDAHRSNQAEPTRAAKPRRVALMNARASTKSAKALDALKASRVSRMLNKSNFGQRPTLDVQYPTQKTFIEELEERTEIKSVAEVSGSHLVDSDEENSRPKEILWTLDRENVALSNTSGFNPPRAAGLVRVHEKEKAKSAQSNEAKESTHKSSYAEAALLAKELEMLKLESLEGSHDILPSSLTTACAATKSKQELTGPILENPQESPIPDSDSQLNDDHQSIFIPSIHHRVESSVLNHSSDELNHKNDQKGLKKPEPASILVIEATLPDVRGNFDPLSPSQIANQDFKRLSSTYHSILDGYARDETIGGEIAITEQYISPAPALLEPQAMGDLCQNFHDSETKDQQEELNGTEVADPLAKNEPANLELELPGFRDPSFIDCRVSFAEGSENLQPRLSTLEPSKRRSLGGCSLPTDTSAMADEKVKLRIVVSLLTTIVKKIGEATFSEVYFCVDNKTNRAVAVKVMPFGTPIEELPEDCEPQITTHEVSQEILVTQALSKFERRDTDVREQSLSSESNFVELLAAYVCEGEYPSALLESWDDWTKLNDSENLRPDFFGENQLFAVLVLAHGGTDLEHFRIRPVAKSVAPPPGSTPIAAKTRHALANGGNNDVALSTNKTWAVVRSILLQTIFSLASAECALKFEHRDLHWGNILCATNEVLVGKSKRYTLPSLSPNGNWEMNDSNPSIFIDLEGVKVTIIDYTLSRCEVGEFALRLDDESYFTGEDDYQFDIYRKMRDETKGKWDEYCPKTTLM